MIDLLVGGTLGGWAAENAPAHLARVLDAPAEDPAPGAVLLSVHYPRILAQDVLDRYGGAAYNLHPGLLPYGRGMFPVFWALWEATPAGATLHRMTAGLDRGPVVDQIAVALHAQDTGGSAHARVQAAEKALFLRWLPRLASGERPPGTPQPATGGTYHDRAEFEMLRDAPPAHLSPAERRRLERALKY